MKLTTLVLTATVCAASLAGATQPAPRLVYKESQFASRLEYLRFCQRYALHDHRCD